MKRVRESESESESESEREREKEREVGKLSYLLSMSPVGHRFY